MKTSASKFVIKAVVLLFLLDKETSMLQRKRDSKFLAKISFSLCRGNNGIILNPIKTVDTLGCNRLRPRLIFRISYSKNVRQKLPSLFFFFAKIGIYVDYSLISRKRSTQIFELNWCYTIGVNCFFFFFSFSLVNLILYYFLRFIYTYTSCNGIK